MKKALTTLLISCIVLLLVPFRFLYADDIVTISLSNIVDIVPISHGPEPYNNGSTLLMILDNMYQGYVNVKLNYTYFDNNNTLQSGTNNWSFNVQGNYGYYDAPINIIAIQSFSINSQSLHSMSNTEYVYNLDYRDFIGYQYWELYGMSMSNINDIPCLYTNSFPQITTSTFNNSTPFIRMTEEPMYIAYFSNINDAQNTVSAIVGSSSTCTVSVERINNDLFTSYNVGGYVFNLFKFTITKPSDDYELVSWKDIYTVNWGQKVGNITEIIPIYYGNQSGMSNEMSLFLGFGDPYSNFLESIDNNIEFITNIEYWNVPLYSYPFILKCLTDIGEPIYISNYYKFQYPVFDITNTNNVNRFLTTYLPHQKYKMIFMMSFTSFNDNPLSFIAKNTNNINVTSEKINVLYNTNYGYISTVILTIENITDNNISTVFTFRPLSSTYQYLFIPIYFGLNSGYFDNDFALQYGLDNRLLDDLDKIANGTTQSNQSSSNLDDANNDMMDSFTDFSSFETSMDNTFDIQLQNIDFSNPLTNNSSILPAANFVISVFNGLILNNPLSILIIIVCILLLAKRIIGK